jgi:hypothetical protein
MLTFMNILLRTVLVFAAAVFMASLLVAGAVIALVYALWCLLRGQRPQWPRVFLGPLGHMRRSQRWAGGGQRDFRAAPAEAGVVEGQARELT